MLNMLKEHPEAWTRVDTILEFSQNQQTKYFALQILEKTIKTRWKALPRHQCDGRIKSIDTSQFILRIQIFVLKLDQILKENLNIFSRSVQVATRALTVCEVKYI